MERPVECPFQPDQRNPKICLRADQQAFRSPKSAIVITPILYRRSARGKFLNRRAERLLVCGRKATSGQEPSLVVNFPRPQEIVLKLGR